MDKKLYQKFVNRICSICRERIEKSIPEFHAEPRDPFILEMSHGTLELNKRILAIFEEDEIKISEQK